MKSGLSFLVAARRCEIEELEQLGHTGELVGAIARLVHALQRERGLSNVFLSSSGARFAAERGQQVAQCVALERQVRAGLDQLETEVRRGGNGARLFSRVAWVLPGLDALPDLRRRIGAQGLSPAQATAAFVKLVAGLLAVVFEAADGATDPEISRRLVALFNFMQGKEFAGQERALGSGAFVSGTIDAARQQHWLHLVESQERCFQLFCDFSEPEVVALWRRRQNEALQGERERLRRIGTGGVPGLPFGTDWSSAWFDCCSACIDAMKQVEDRLADSLRAQCAGKLAEAQRALARERGLLETLQACPDGAAPATPVFFDEEGAADTPSPYGRQLERSVLDMLQEQSRRLEAMSDELATVRVALDERKLVERAKGLLMAHRRLSEDEAHKMLRQTAMSQKRRIVEVAESVLAMADFLPAPAAPPRDA